jgi:predicted DNA-binding transcriptional regulator YafY
MSTTAKYHHLMVPGNRLIVVYKDMQEQITERIITIERTTMQGIVFAHCELRNAIRCFCESRILWADYATAETVVETFADMREREVWSVIDALPLAHPPQDYRIAAHMVAEMEAQAAAWTGVLAMPGRICAAVA